jgi:hypothetical protein
MGKMKELAIALMRGDSLSELSEAERNYVSTLSPAEYASARGADYSDEQYQEYKYLVEKERKEAQK